MFLFHLSFQLSLKDQTHKESHQQVISFWKVESVCVCGFFFFLFPSHTSCSYSVNDGMNTPVLVSKTTYPNNWNIYLFWCIYYSLCIHQCFLLTSGTLWFMPYTVPPCAHVTQPAFSSHIFGCVASHGKSAGAHKSGVGCAAREREVVNKQPRNFHGG